MAEVQLQPNVAVAPAPAVVNGAIDSGGPQLITTSLYVGDLDVNVSDSQLYDLFNQLGQVVSVRVCRDLSSRRSLGYGYVNYTNPEVAGRAIKDLNFTPLNGKPIRIMYSQRDDSIRKEGKGNVFIKNLDKTIDHKSLHSTFSTYGNILSCKVATDGNGQSKGYGFVQYNNEESAKRAIEEQDGKFLREKQVYVGPFVRRQQRENSVDKTKFSNVYVKNLSDSTSDEQLRKTFGEFGTITSAVVMADSEGKSKCFGFVNFEKADDAARAVEALNGRKVDEKEWYVGRAQKKAEREAELKNRHELSMKEVVDKYKGANLYVKNLDDSVDDDKLKELFSPFGSVASCKVMRDPNGISRGSGFVAFTTAEEASRALTEMKGKMVVGKPLYVALAQHKEDRRARLQAQFSQMLPMVMPAAVGPRMPMYPLGLGVGQPLYYGQGPPPPIIPPQQQLVPGLRPGGAPALPNFYVPMLQRPNAGTRRSAQQQQPPMQMIQQQLLPRERYRHPQARGPPDAPSGLSPQAVGSLATLLVDAPPDTQRMLLGESLYPLVEQIEAEMAAKVTGMLLEMDQNEVLNFLESPDALKAKVAEAMDVLKNVSHQNQNQTSNAADNNLR
ncbi:hypothetical protein V2J09_016787 [Rumex salicifolius]